MSSRNYLNFQEKLKLAEFIKVRYVESKLSDSDFADLAFKELDMAVTMPNIRRVRINIGIEANFNAGASLKDSAKLKENADLRLEVTQLNKRVAALENRINVYFEGCTKK